MREQQLEIKVINGVLSITIGIDVLCNSLEYGVDRYFTEDVKIVDNDLFLDDFVRELSCEEEDGTTLVHRMLDNAAYKAIENGANGVTLDGE